MARSHGEQLKIDREQRGRATSDLGVKVATIMGTVWGGLHHFPTKDHYRYVELPIWAEERHIRILLNKGMSLATWDAQHLTGLVILAHEFCVRMDIEPATIGTLALSFWPRQRNTGSTMTRHPTITEAVSRWTAQRPERAPRHSGALGHEGASGERETPAEPMHLLDVPNVSVTCCGLVSARVRRYTTVADQATCAACIDVAGARSHAGDGQEEAAGYGHGV